MILAIPCKRHFPKESSNSNSACLYVVCSYYSQLFLKPTFLSITWSILSPTTTNLHHFTWPLRRTKQTLPSNIWNQLVDKKESIKYINFPSEGFQSFDSNFCQRFYFWWPISWCLRLQRVDTYTLMFNYLYYNGISLDQISNSRCRI